jgi:sulfhydrogenase subunit beta (sulfur reductase)
VTKSFVLSKCCFDDFLSILKELGSVYAPVRVSDQSFSFRKVESANEIALEAIRTILPPKKFFYPQRETLISYDSNGIYEHEPPMEFMTLFGVHPCDLAGLGIMDTIYSAAPADTHYLRRREACLVIGLSCMPDKHCFCQSMGTANAEKGYDIFFTDIGDDFFLEAVTPAAVKVMNSAASIVKAVTPEYMEAYKGFWQRRSEAFTNGFAADNLHSLMDLEIDNKVWDELGSRCLSCGNCTPVCPTCYCFDLVDIASLHEDSGERVREWDSCQFTGFAKVSGDFNFRPTPVDRFKFWYRHKLHGFDDPYGFKTCVGCGRCTVSCPSGIDDIVAVVKTLQASKENDKASDN